MAEFCLDCWNKLNGARDSKKRYFLSDELERLWSRMHRAFEEMIQDLKRFKG